MGLKLAEIVDSALREAHQQVKVASLRDAPIQDRGFARVDQYLADALGQSEVETPKVASAAEVQQTKATQKLAAGYDAVQFAKKLAQALNHGSTLVEKLAGPLNKSDGGAPHSGSPGPGGPVKLYKQPHENDRVISPKPQASAHARAAQANTTVHNGFPKNDADMQLNEGPVIPSNYPTSKTTTGGHSKKASAMAAQTERLLKSKIAQHKMLVSLGQIDAANAVAAEAQKIADESNVGGNVRIFDDNYNSSKVMPDNEGVRNLTKAQARDAHQREAGAFFGEPVKKDNAVTAHMMSTEGLKLSHAARMLKKASRGFPAAPGGNRQGKTAAAIDLSAAKGVLGRGKQLLTGSRAGALDSAASTARTRRNAVDRAGIKALGSGNRAYADRAMNLSTKLHERAQRLGQQAVSETANPVSRAGSALAGGRRAVVEKMPSLSQISGPRAPGAGGFKTSSFRPFADATGSSRTKSARAGGNREEPGFWEKSHQHETERPVHAGASAVAGGLIGGVYGGMLGHIASDASPAATGVGAGLGALGMGALSYHSAKGQEKYRQRLLEDRRLADKARGKKASVDPVMAICQAVEPAFGGVFKVANAGEVSALFKDVTKKKGIGRVGQLLSGSRAKKLEEVANSDKFKTVSNRIGWNKELADVADDRAAEGDKVFGARVGTGLLAGGGTLAAMKSKESSFKRANAATEAAKKSPFTQRVGRKAMEWTADAKDKGFSEDVLNNDAASFGRKILGGGLALAGTGLAAGSAAGSGGN